MHHCSEAWRLRDTAEFLGFSQTFFFEVLSNSTEVDSKSRLNAIQYLKKFRFVSHGPM
jgi:hypothetical protein